MPTPGTIIATIPAGGVTAVASGLSNQASTSTDNVVTYVAPCITPTCPVQSSIGDAAMVDVTSAVGYNDTHVFVSGYFDGSVHAIDVTNVCAPTLVATITHASLNGAWGMAITGTTLLVACENSDALVALNISDPANPTITSSFTNAVLDRPRSVAVSGSYAFVTSFGTDRLVSVNITNPAAMTLASSVTHSSRLDGASGVAIIGTVAYVVASLGSRIEAVDISNPNSIGLGANFSHADIASPQYIAARGNTILVGSVAASKLVSVLIGSLDPFNLSYGDTLTDATINFPRGITVSPTADIFYVASQVYDGVVAIDASTPTILSVKASVTDASMDGALGVGMFGDYVAVVGTDSQEMALVAADCIGGPLAGTPRLRMRGTVSDAVLNRADGVLADPGGQYVYVACETPCNFVSVDVSDPDAPFVAGYVTNATSLFRVFDLAWAGTGMVATIAQTGDCVTMVDVSTPTSPTIVGTTGVQANLDNPRSIVVSGGVAFVLTGQNRITSVNISTPSAPVIISSFQDGPNFNNPWDFAVRGTVAFVCSNTGDRLVSVDISNPASMSTISTLTDSTQLNGVWGIFISGTLAYCACDQDRLTIVDISNPASMSIVSSTLSSQYLDVAHGVHVYNGVAYVTAYATNSNVAAYDVTTPATPVLVGNVKNRTVMDSPWDIARIGNFLYVSGNFAQSLTVLEITA